MQDRSSLSPPQQEAHRETNTHAHSQTSGAGGRPGHGGSQRRRARRARWRRSRCGGSRRRQGPRYRGAVVPLPYASPSKRMAGLFGRTLVHTTVRGGPNLSRLNTMTGGCPNRLCSECPEQPNGPRCVCVAALAQGRPGQGGGSRARVWRRWVVTAVLRAHRETRQLLGDACHSQVGGFRKL